MQNILTIPLCQGTFLRSKNHERINNSVSHGTIELISHDNYEPTMSSLEEISVVKAKEALTKNLLTPREAMPGVSNLGDAVEATGIFNESNNAKSLDEEIEALEKKIKQTYAKQQTRRARKYNIPFDVNTVNYHQLCRKINHYEVLLQEAKEWDVSWDLKVYDPVALKQEVDESRSRFWNEVFQKKSRKVGV